MTWRQLKVPRMLLVCICRCSLGVCLFLIVDVFKDEHVMGIVVSFLSEWYSVFYTFTMSDE